MQGQPLQALFNGALRRKANRIRKVFRQVVFDLPDGIYRVKGRGASGIQLLFTYARKKPTVPKIFDYYGFVGKHVAAYVPRELARHLR